MAYGTIYTGANFTINHYIETSYGTGTTGATAVGNLGIAEKVTTFNIQNQYNPLYSLGSREIQAYYSKGWKVSLNVEFVMCGDNKNWLNYVLQSNGVSPPTYDVGGIKSDAIQIATGEGTVYVINGIIYTDANITVTEGDIVKVTLSGVGRAMTSYTGTITTTIPSDLYTYKDVTASTVGNLGNGIIKDFSIDIKNSPEQYYSLGSLEYQAYLPTKFEASGSWTVYHNSSPSEMPTVLPTTATSSADVITPFSTVYIGTDANKYTFSVSAGVINEGEMTVEPVTVVLDKITYIGSAVSVT